MVPQINLKPFDSEYKFVSGSEKVILIEIQCLVESRIVRIPNEKKSDKLFKHENYDLLRLTLVPKLFPQENGQWLLIWFSYLFQK
jgi:hypothetical protein